MSSVYLTSVNSDTAEYLKFRRLAFIKLTLHCDTYEFKWCTSLNCKHYFNHQSKKKEVGVHFGACGILLYGHLVH